MVSMFSSGVSAFQSAQRSAMDASQRIAEASVDGEAGDLTEAVVDLQMSKQQALAAGAILERGFDLTGILLDIEV